MEGLEDTYLEFVSSGFCYLIGIRWVKEILENGNWKEDLPVMEWGRLTGEWKNEKNQKYGILVEYAQQQFGIPAEEVIGMQEVKKGQMLELKEPVRNEKNRFISAAANCEEGDRGLVFVLDPRVLMTYACQ